nr:holo-ACP synthase [Pedobacter xinjiangensis]
MESNLDTDRITDKITNTVSSVAEGRSFVVGNDLVFLPDFKHSLTELFKQRVYTETERNYCNLFDDSLLRYASTWAAKEAVYKAIKQIDPAPLSWRKIEIRRDKIAGKPSVVLHDQENFYPISLTISHDGDYVWALAILSLK